AEEPAHAVLLLQYVDRIERRRAAIRLLQCGKRAHERRLARAVRPEEAEHPRLDRQRHMVERLDAVRVTLRKIADDKLHSNSPGNGATYHFSSACGHALTPAVPEASASCLYRRAGRLRRAGSKCRGRYSCRRRGSARHC